METKVNNVASAVEKILEGLPERYKDVLIKRYGLKPGVSRCTLESIGQFYGVTRERVRQIENAAKKLILETDVLLLHTKQAVKDLKKAIDSLGGVAAEQDILNQFTDNEDGQDYLHFILNLSDPFFVEKNKEYKDTIWYTKENSFEAFEKSIKHLYRDIKTDEILTEEDIVGRFVEKIKEHTDDKKLLKLDVVKKLIEVSKNIGSNQMGHWGRADSRHIHLKGARDYAYLVLKSEEKPLHFSEISEKIVNQFGKEINVATVHNELIKDERFILVGRGKYGLKEWGSFSGGTVSEVIKKVLKKNKKAMTKEEILEEVLKQKEVRKQTILINLSKKKLFKKTKDGKYTIA